MEAGRPAGWSGPSRLEADRPVGATGSAGRDGAGVVDPGRLTGASSVVPQEREPSAAGDRPSRRRTDGEAASGEGSPSRNGRPSCTQSQLRRFIKSRPYVPLHELRRRFAIDGAEDDVVRIEVEGRGLFVGLPRAEAEMLRELVRSGEVGVELLVDPETPVVVGVYPMRPVPRS